jgi:pimeloyl-ACP methyl ester carboxylesterase
MSTVTSKDGTSIAFSETGRGPAVVLVDGATAHRAVNPTGAEIASLLASDFTVYRYDRRGRGESGDTHPFAPLREIEDLDAIIAEAGGRAFVMGGSSGGALVLDAAAQGLPIPRLAVYETPFIVDDSRPPVPGDYLTKLQSLSAAERRSEAVDVFFTDALLMPPDAVAGMHGSPFWPELEKVAPTIAYDAAFMEGTMTGHPLPADRWSSVAIPVLVLDGGASDTFMHTGADALAGLLPNAERRTLEGQTHDVAPSVLAPELADFFSR